MIDEGQAAQAASTIKTVRVDRAENRTLGPAGVELEAHLSSLEAQHETWTSKSGTADKACTAARQAFLNAQVEAAAAHALCVEASPDKKTFLARRDDSAWKNHVATIAEVDLATKEKELRNPLGLILKSRNDPARDESWAHAKLIFFAVINGDAGAIERHLQQVTPDPRAKKWWALHRARMLKEFKNARRADGGRVPDSAMADIVAAFAARDKQHGVPAVDPMTYAAGV